MQRDEVSTIASDYASETVRRFFDATGPYGPIMRAANGRRISEEIWPLLGVPPSTDLGDRAAAWPAEWSRT